MKKTITICITLILLLTIEGCKTIGTGKELEKPVTIYILHNGSEYLPEKKELRIIRQTMRAWAPKMFYEPDFEKESDYRLKVVGRYVNGEEFEVMYSAGYPWINKGTGLVYLPEETAKIFFRIIKETCANQSLEVTPQL